MASSIPGQPFLISAGAQRKVHITATKTVNGVTSPVQVTLSGVDKVGAANGVLTCAADPTDPNVLIVKNPANTAPASTPQQGTINVSGVDALSNVTGLETFTATAQPKPTITITIATVDEEEPIPTS